MEQMIESINNVFRSIKKFFQDLWTKVKKVLFKMYSRNKEFRKLYSCYSKTKKKRIRKKYYKKMIGFIAKNPMIV